MSHLDISVLHRTRRNEASIALAGEGTGASKIRLLDAAGGTLLGVRTLADPCGAIVAATGRIQLAQATADDLVVASGSAGFAEWVNGDGVVIATGAVTDAAGAGPFKLTGGTALYAGGILRLVEPALLG